MAEKFCSLCGKRLKNGVCPDCGGGIYEAADEYIAQATAPEYTENFNTAKFYSVDEDKLTAVKKNAWKFIVAVLMPMLGLIFGIYTVTGAKSEAERKLGRNLLITSGIAFLAGFVIQLLAMPFLALLS